MMRHGRWLALILLLLVIVLPVAARGRKDAPERKPNAVPDSAQMREGIRGKIEVWEGNFMPMMDPRTASGKITPGIGRRVRVHEPLKLSMGHSSARRDSVPTALVAEAVSDSSGRFFIPVKPGTYSIFVEESGGWYYNGWNGEGVQGAVTVESGKVTDVVIKITAKAVY
jgi:hypothetical protein